MTTSILTEVTLINLIHKLQAQIPEERNVTHMPDGRVLKGTLDEQHKKAEFWTEIAQESDELVKQVESGSNFKRRFRPSNWYFYKTKNKLSHSPSQRVEA